jgi:hypothetical protein
MPGSRMSDRGARRFSTRLGIASAALAAGAGGVMATPHGLDWTRGAIEGIVAGGRLASDAGLSLLLHPAAALRGATLAANNHADVLQEWSEAGAAYATAWQVDPVGFATTSFTLVGCATACVLAAWGLEGAGDRVARMLARAVRNLTRHVQGSRRGRIVRLWRARAMRLEQRRGQRALGVRALLQRIGWWARDATDGLRLLVAQPASATVFFAGHAAWISLGVAGSALRLGWQQIAYLALPIGMFCATWISFSVHLDEVAGAAQRSIAPAAKRYVNEVAELNMADLASRTDQMHARYAEHRQRLVEPITELDSEVARDLNGLRRAVAAGGLDPGVVTYRMDRLLFRHARHRLLLAEQILRPTDTPHGPYEPSLNWLESIRDEQALFEAARVRSTRPEWRRYLDKIAAAVEARWSYESCILRYDRNQLAQRPPSIPPHCDAPAGAGAQP